MAEITPSPEQPTPQEVSIEPVSTSHDISKSPRRPLGGIKGKIAAALTAATFFNLGGSALPQNNQGLENSGLDSAAAASSSNFAPPKQRAEISIPTSLENKSKSILEQNPNIQTLVEQANFYANGSIEISTYKEPPYFSPPGREFLKIRNATILFRGEPDPKTDVEQVILGIKAKEFGGRLVLISGTINKKTVIYDSDSALLGRGPSAFPKNLDDVDIGVHLDYLKDGPIETAADEATNVRGIDELHKELHGETSTDPNKIYPFILTRVQSINQ